MVRCCLVQVACEVTAAQQPKNTAPNQPGGELINSMTLVDPLGDSVQQSRAPNNFRPVVAAAYNFCMWTDYRVIGAELATET